MTAITINLNDVQSTSAKPSVIKTAKVNGRVKLLIDAEKKSAVNQLVSLTKKARTLALNLLAAKGKVAAQEKKASSRHARPEQKEAAAAQAKALKKTVTELTKSTKAAIKDANAYARSEGLSALILPVSTDDITGDAEHAVGQIARLKARRPSMFGIKGKKEIFVPAFVSSDKLKSAGTKTGTTNRSDLMRYVKNPEADLSKLTDEELATVNKRLREQRDSSANMGTGKKAGTMHHTDTISRIYKERKARRASK